MTPAGVSVDKAVHEFESRIRTLETEKLLEFQEKITRRVNFVLWPAFTIFTIISLAAGLFGYTSFQSFQSGLEEAKKNIDSRKKEIEEAMLKTLGNMRIAQNELADQRQKFGQENKKLGTISGEVDSKLKAMRAAQQRVESIETKVAKYKSRVKEDSEKVRNLKNSFFEVYVRCDLPEGTAKSCKGFANLLSEEAGFSGVTEPEENSTVDKPEVVYYHPSSASQAAEIAELLAKYLGVRVEPRYDNRSDAEARHVLLVKLQGY
ncbi:MAG: hypothetical protein ACRERV_03000 [Methylococcales bacterium]